MRLVGTVALLGCALLAVSAAAQSPPPVIIPTAPPMPPVFRAPAQMTYRIQVDARLGSQLLYAGELSLTSRGSASFNQTRNESFACGGSSDYGPGVEALSSSLRITLNGSGNPGTIGVSVTHVRPLAAEQTEVLACGDGRRSTRTVGVETRVTLPDAKPVRIQGDAGLVVTLTRLP